MSDDIPFDKNLELAPDTVDEPMPGVRRVMANNPGPFTFKGTVSYILGRGKVAIIDPGPDDPAHVGALLDAVRGETVTHIFVTHTHRDHSPAVPAIKAATGIAARVLGKEGTVGSLTSGAFADFVVTDANPLEDVRVLSAPEHIRLVIQEGRAVAGRDVALANRPRMPAPFPVSLWRRCEAASG